MNKEKVTKRLSNEGFSLVELIIVIAIMAVLVGVITPQYIKYVNKSKAAVDVQTMDTLRNAMNVTVLDPTVVKEPISSPIASTDIGVGIGTYNDAFWKEVYGVFGINTKKADNSDKTVAEMTTEVKGLLKLNPSAAIKYTYNNGRFSIEVVGDKYTGACAVKLD